LNSISFNALFDQFQVYCMNLGIIIDLGLEV